jgi:hypothetical protein
MRPAWCLALLALVSPACASTRAQDSLNQLKDSVEAYNEAFRWKNFERAAMYMPNDLRAAFIATYEDDENSLHVEDYQILGVNVESELSAVVTVRLRYMMLPSVTVAKATLVQHWKRVADAWMLETEDGSIRELDPNKLPRNPDVKEPDPTATGEPSNDAVQVEDPKGNVIRKDPGFGNEGEEEDED